MVGTSLGCAGYPGLLYMSSPLPDSSFEAGSMRICELYVSGDPGLHGEALMNASSGPDSSCAECNL